MRKSVAIKTNEGGFKYRSSAVILNEDETKILLVCMSHQGFYCLPGGYIELGETSEEGMLRELKEELLVDFKIDKFLGIAENFFDSKYGTIMHEVGMYYKASPLGNLSREDFQLVENDKGHIIDLEFKWFSIDDLNKCNFKPNFMKDLVISKNIEFGHVINKDK